MEQDNDGIDGKIAERSEQALVPLTEDVAEWLTKTLKKKITPKNIFNVLDNGVLVCQLAEKVTEAAEKYVRAGPRAKSSQNVRAKGLPKFTTKFHTTAEKESFFARENAASFLNWCREIGIQNSTLFESEGLVLHKQPKNVILTLLEIGRIAANYGMEPPNLIKLEREIEREEREKHDTNGKGKTHSDPIDAKVREACRKYKVDMQRVKEGKYLVNGKTTIFVRFLRNHVMVRVGGGWDELEHFLTKHDPQRVGKVLTSTPSGKVHDVLH